MSSLASDLTDVVIPNAAQPRKRRFTVDALFTDHRPQAVGVADLPTAKEIQLDRIEADPAQPRQTFDPAKLAELTASIRIEGVLQPIVVRYDGDRDAYVIVHGERRWRASREAGLSSIPALVREVPADRRLVQQLMENIVRDDLNAIDRAAALRTLKTQLGDAPWEQVAEAVGIRRSRLFQLLGTEKLPDAIQEDIRSGRLSEKQSRTFQGLPESAQLALRDAIIENDLSAEDATRISRELRARRIPEDRLSIQDTIHAFLHPTPSSRGGRDELAELLAAVGGAASGAADERNSLKRLADEFNVGPFDADQLQVEVLALARSLARTPRTELRPGSSTFSALVALYGALDAALVTDVLRAHPAHLLPVPFGVISGDRPFETRRFAVLCRGGPGAQRQKIGAATPMTSRENFSDEEWTLLQELPFDVILAAIVSDVNGALGSVARETVAAARELVQEGVKFLDVPLIAELLADMAEESIPADDEKVKRGDDRARGEAIAVAFARAGDAGAMLDARGDVKQSGTYKKWVYDAAVAATTATKSGGVMGIGAKTVSEAEADFLDRLAGALAYSPPTE